MTCLIRSLIVTIALLIAVPSLSQDTGGAKVELMALVDDLSRQELFSKVIAAELSQPNSSLTEFPIPADFFFPQDARFDKIANKERDNVIFGIDISHHTNAKLDLSLLKLQKVDFVYAKATQGVGFKDPKFGSYWTALAKLPETAKPLRGAYHFLSANAPGRNQADTFVDFLLSNGGWLKDDMPPCLDLEWDVVSGNPDQWQGKSPDEIMSNVRAWLERVKERTGRTPAIYTARAWWRERNIPESAFSGLDEYPIWIADYSKSHKATEKPAVINGRSQDLWQFADNARLTTGYPGGTLDANVFYGTLTQFKQKFGLPN